MKKIFVPLMPLMMTFALSASASAARVTTTTASEETTVRDNPWEFSVQGQGVFPVQDEAKDRFDNTAGAAARLTYDVVPNVALGAEGGWLRFKDEVNGTKFG